MNPTGTLSPTPASSCAARLTTFTLFRARTGEDAPAPEAIPALANDPERSLFVGMKDEG